MEHVCQLCGEALPADAPLVWRTSECGQRMCHPCGFARFTVCGCVTRPDRCTACSVVDCYWYVADEPAPDAPEHACAVCGAVVGGHEPVGAVTSRCATWTCYSCHLPGRCRACTDAHCYTFVMDVLHPNAH